MKSLNSENFWELRPGLLGVFDFLRVTAVFVGYAISGLGWLLFFNTLLVATSYRLTPGDADFFRLIGRFIVIGWLMLRFAAGLFPFGRHLFKWQKHKG